MKNKLFDFSEAIDTEIYKAQPCSSNVAIDQTIGDEYAAVLDYETAMRLLDEPPEPNEKLRALLALRRK